MISKVVTLLAVFCLFSQVFAQEKPRCKIDITKLPEPQPLILNAYTYEYLYPPVDNMFPDHSIPLDIGDTVIIACSGGVITPLGHPTVYATCNDKQQLIVDDKNLPFYNLNCTQNSVFTRPTTRQCGQINGDSKIVEVGYEIGNQLKWLPILEVCFNPVTRSTLYSKYTLSKSLPYRQFITHKILEQPDLYNLPETDLSLAYDLSMETINKQVGLPLDSRKYMNIPFRRTRLASEYEIFYSSQYEAISVAANTVPEWYKSCWNWEDVDEAVQHYALKHELDLEVYTGTHGTVTVLHEQTFENVTLHLYEYDNISAIPIPGLMWKLAYDPKNLQAIVFITVNVPIDMLYKEHIICEDISRSVSWQPWLDTDMHNFTCGYSYACEYYSFLWAVPDAPIFRVNGVLY